LDAGVSDALLRDVIASVGPEVLEGVHVPARRTIGVSDVSFFDPTDPHSVRADAVILALGLPSAAGEAFALVDSAGRRGAAAVVFRAGAEFEPRLIGLADALEVALFVASPEMSWGQLYSLLRTALVSAGTAGRAEVEGVALGDLFALADATAAAVGGAVTIEDPQWRVLAYSNLGHPIDDARRDTILGRTPTLAWQQRIEDTGVGRALRFEPGVVRLEGGLAPRIAAPVRAGSELLGSIWVAEGHVELGAAAEAELARIAERAAVHLISHRISDDLKRRMRGAFVREVLEGRLGPRAEQHVVADGPFTVLVFESAQADHRLVNSERVLSIVTLYSENTHPEAMCALIDDRYWALVPARGAHERERTTELAEKVIAGVESVMPVRLTAGIGMQVPTVSEVPRSRRAAEQALRVLARRGGPARVVHIGEVRAHAVLLDLLELASPHAGLRDGRLGDLLAADAEHAPQHVATLRAYLDCGGNVARAADRLGLHPNTLRYRVRRLIELSGLDLEDPDERLVTELQLRLQA
jgi:PucR C-terminal helix-turn-helix domain/GGDEF-like domain